MASHLWSEVRALAKGLVYIEGSFAPDTANAPTALKGVGFTVVHTSTGIFTVTLDSVYPSIINATATLQLATAADKVAIVGTIDAAAKTVVIFTLAAGSLADIAANANNRVNFTIVCKNSSVTP